MFTDFEVKLTCGIHYPPGLVPCLFRNHVSVILFIKENALALIREEMLHLGTQTLMYYLTPCQEHTSFSECDRCALRQQDKTFMFHVS